MLAAKRYYLERFQAGDETVMYDVQAPVPEERTGWRNVPGRGHKKPRRQTNMVTHKPSGKFQKSNTLTPTHLRMNFGRQSLSVSHQWLLKELKTMCFQRRRCKP